MYITLYYIVTPLPDSLRSVTDHFLSLYPTTLIVDLLEERLLAVEKSVVAVGASRAGDAAPARARGARALEELARAVEVAMEAVEGVGVVVGVVAGVEASVAAVGAEEAAAVAVGADEAEVAKAAEVAAAAVELVAALRRGVAPVVVSASSSSALVTGTLGISGVGVLVPLSRAGFAIFDLDSDAILAAMYALSTSDEGDCYLCVPLDPCIGEAAALGAGEAAALGASESAAPGAGGSALSGTTSAQASHTFTLN
ncbi:unnamed protein product [Closterium sp. NIES-65]|nr:unnamed protein product [Closterium sp. NIES-65]